MAKASKGNSDFVSSHDGAKQLGRNGGIKSSNKATSLKMPRSATGANISAFNGASGVGKGLRPTQLRSKHEQQLNSLDAKGKPAGGRDNMKAAGKQMRNEPLSVPTSGRKRQPAGAQVSDGRSTPKSVAKSPHSGKDA